MHDQDCGCISKPAWRPAQRAASAAGKLRSKQQFDVECDFDRFGWGDKDWRGDMACVRPHQDRIANRLRVERRTVYEAYEARRPDQSRDAAGIISRLMFVPTQHRRAMAEFGEMIGAGASQRKPSSQPQHPRRLGEIFRGEDTDDEVERSIWTRLTQGRDAIARMRARPRSLSGQSGTGTCGSITTSG